MTFTNETVGPPPPTEPLTITITITHLAQDTYALITSTPFRDGIHSYHTSEAAATATAEHILYNHQQQPNPPLATTFTVPRPPSTRPKQIKIRISPTAWENIQSQTYRHGYAGHSKQTGSTHYLLALIKANPLPTDYTDTRPADLKVFDHYRLSQNYFPFWSAAHVTGLTKATKRIQHLVNAPHITALTTMLLPIADHFLIAPAARGQTDPQLRTAATLEAIGLGYLTPRNPANLNPHPVNAQRSLSRAKHRLNHKIELMF